MKNRVNKKTSAVHITTSETQCFLIVFKGLNTDAFENSGSIFAPLYNVFVSYSNTSNFGYVEGTVIP